MLRKKIILSIQCYFGLVGVLFLSSFFVRLLLISFIATYVWKIGPIKVILLSGLFGGLFYSLF